jgi:hypothetical protein
MRGKSSFWGGTIADMAPVCAAAELLTLLLNGHSDRWVFTIWAPHAWGARFGNRRAADGVREKLHRHLAREKKKNAAQRINRAADLLLNSLPESC